MSEPLAVNVQDLGWRWAFDALGETYVFRRRFDACGQRAKWSLSGWKPTPLRIEREPREGVRYIGCWAPTPDVGRQEQIRCASAAALPGDPGTAAGQQSKAESEQP